MYVVIPMAGLGSRFAKVGINRPKPLIEVNGLTLIEHSVKSFDVDAKFVFITRASQDSQADKELTSLLMKLRPESVQVQIQDLTDGAAQTCLAVKDLINNDEELVIYNCDQILRWNPQDFLSFVRNNDCDGAVVLYHSTDPKNSFALVENGAVTRTVEKKPISDSALVGFHYWKRGRDFVGSAERLIQEFRSQGSPECYVSETYNFLIENGAKILPYFVSNNKYIPLGTPEDVTKYLGKVKEFDSNKPKTIFCDIDGTVLKHGHSISQVLSSEPEILKGVRKKFDQWDSQGHRIVLTTGRKESVRAHTEQQLNQLGLAYDLLIMGVTSGVRVLINDKLDFDDPDRAIGVNVITDVGFDNIDWESIGL